MRILTIGLLQANAFVRTSPRETPRVLTVGVRQKSVWQRSKRRKQERLKMRAILPAVEISNASQPQNKETINAWVALTSTKGGTEELVTVRWYMSRASSASVVYCCIWVHGKPFRVSGRGSAGGHGYHKSSAALQDAITSAGIKLVGSLYQGTKATYEQIERQEDGSYKRVLHKQDFKKECFIDGCSDTASADAIRAICEALGHKKIYICKG